MRGPFESFVTALACRGLAVAVVLVGLGCDGGSTAADGASTADASTQPDVALRQCPSGAEVPYGAKCDPKVDTQCRTGTLSAWCLCDGYWETDAILRICDAGIGALDDGSMRSDGAPGDASDGGRDLRDSE